MTFSSIILLLFFQYILGKLNLPDVFYSVDDDSGLLKFNLKILYQYCGIRLTSYFRFGVVAVSDDEETVGDCDDSYIFSKLIATDVFAKRRKFLLK